MHAKFVTRAICALALVLLPAAARVTAADPCLCTQRVDFRTSDGPQNWYVTTDASGQLKVTLVLEITTTDTGTVNPDQLSASIYNPAGALVHTITISGSVPGWVRGDFTVAPTVSGDVYRVEIHRAVPHPSPNHASRYWLRLDGASDAAISAIPGLNGGRTTWTFYADAGEVMGVRIHDPLTYPNPPDNYPVMYQWIGPDGTAQPIGSYTVPGPGQDTVIPPPAGPVPGKWKLRLQTLSFAGLGWGYGIEKTTGTDQRLHVEPGDAGVGQGGTVRFVDQFGNPFTDPVGFNFGFGETFSFAIPGGAFEASGNTETFPIPVSITPPAGMIATPSQFAFLSPCDGLFDLTVVISPQPPTLSVTVSPNVLWPPNNKMATIEATITTNATSVELVSITSSEPGSGDIDGAALGTDDRTFRLRAQRNGGGPGRTYTVTYRATDTATGASTTATATVVVPHDQGQ